MQEFLDVQQLSVVLATFAVAAAADGGATAVVLL